MQIKDYYNSLHSDMKSILEKALQEDNLDDVAIAHSFMTDFGDWLNVLQVRPEIDIFQNAIKGYHIALLSAILGLYQQAFIGLRFASRKIFSCSILLSIRNRTSVVEIKWQRYLLD